MIFDAPFAQLLFSLGLIASAPLLFSISKAATRFLLNRFMADEIINVRYVEDGRVTAKVTIKSKTDGSVVTKIKMYQEQHQ